MAHVVKFERGTSVVTTLDLNQQGTNDWLFRLMEDSWQPATAERRWSTLQTTPFLDLQESFEVMIQGETKQAVMDGYRQLVVWLDAMRVLTRYGDTDAISPVRFVVQLDGSSTAWRSLVIVEADDPPCVEFSSAFLTNQNQLLQRNVRVQFRHRMLTKTAETANFVGATCGDVVNINFGAALDTSAPTQISVGSWNGLTATYRPTSGALIVAESITTLEADGHTGTDFSAVADATKAASGNILRFTPTATTKRSTGLISTTLLRKFLVFAEIRNNTAGKEYALSLNFLGGGFSTQTRTAIVKPTSTNVQLVGLGLVQCPTTPTQWQINLQASSTGGTIDIDRIYLVAYGPETAVTAFGAVNTSVSGTAEIVLDPRWLTHPDGTEMRYQSTGSPSSKVPFATLDAIATPWTSTAAIAVLFLAYSNSGGWALHSAGTRLTGLTVAASRQPSAIVPW
ncbi:MAG: hypothetical protein LCH85_22240 [Chloroflexi bacterium]|nr:hypothetical protein [Chloroflexota bacterium]